MDRLETMTVFARVAELESFTGAAKSLGLPKATVSKAVFQLEERLGARLLQRTTRRVSLTHDGRAFYERCKDLLVDAEEVERLFQKSGETLKGRIRIDLPSRLARLRVIPQLPKFLAEHPMLELEVGSTDRPVDLVREGYDCVVRVGSAGDAGVIARRIGEMRLINLASPTYLKARGVPRRLEDLDNHEVVHWAGTFGQRPGGWEYQEDGEWKERPMKGRVTVNNAEAYVAAAVAGLGLIQTAGQSESAAAESSGGVYVVPAFTGLGAPHWDSQARGAIYGITRDTTAAQLVRATLEGVAHQVADLFDTGGLGRISSLGIDGGMSANKLFAAILADLTGVEIVRSPYVEMTAFGAARAAMLGCGEVSSLKQAITSFSGAPSGRSKGLTIRPQLLAEGRRLLRAGWRQAVIRTRGGGAAAPAISQAKVLERKNRSRSRRGGRR